FAEVAAVDLGTALAGGADKANGEALIVRHGDDGRLAVAGQALDADLLGIHGLVRLEVIEGATGTPRPGAQCPPVVHLAWLPLVAQADDAFGQPGTVVGLNAIGEEDGITPALGEHLLLPGRAGGGGGTGRRRRGAGARR